jgi:hypothetical protein
MRKEATSAHVVPQIFQNLGFQFRFDFRASLQDCAASAPDDFR